MAVVGINEQQMSAIRKALMNFKSKTGALASVLSHNSGLIVAYSMTDQLPIEALSALMAGLFAASREFFGLLGKSLTGSIMMEGDKFSVYATHITDEFLFFVVFPTDQVRLGVLKLHIGQIRRKLSPVLSELDTTVFSQWSVKSSKKADSKEETTESPSSGGIDSIIEKLKEELEKGFSQQ